MINELQDNNKNLLGLEITIEIDGVNQKIYSVVSEQDNPNYVINGTDRVRRIPLTETDLAGLQYRLSKPKVGWGKRGKFKHGKYSVKYNSIEYRMTYLDELELFKQVVFQG